MFPAGLVQILEILSAEFGRDPADLQPSPEDLHDALLGEWDPRPLLWADPGGSRTPGRGQDVPGFLRTLPGSLHHCQEDPSPGGLVLPGASSSPGAPADAAAHHQQPLQPGQTPAPWNLLPSLLPEVRRVQQSCGGQS